MSRFLHREGFVLLLLLSLLLPAQRAAAQGSAADAAALVAAVTAGAPALDESFRADTGDWELSGEEDYGLRYEAGTYRIDVPAADQYVWGIHQDFDAGDFYLEVDAYTLSGPEDNQVGVVFRHADTENFYTFVIGADGQFELLRFASGVWTELLPRQPSGEIVTGLDAVNRLGVLAQGAELTLFVNGEVVGSATDEGLPSGTVGLAAGAFAEGGVFAAFDDLRVWRLGESAAAPTAEPVEEATAEPTEAPSTGPAVEPTVQPEVRVPPAGVTARVDAIRLTQPLLSEQFRRDTGAWSLNSDETVTYAIAGRTLTIRVDAENLMGWSAANDVSANDLFFEADGTLRAGPEEAEYGLLLREQPGGNFYFFAVTGLGSFGFWKSVDQEWTELVPWTAADAIAAGVGATNRLGALVEGSTFTLFANGEPLAQVDDSSFSGGGVALAAGTFDAGGAEVAFDNVSLWPLDGAAPALPTAEPLPTPEALPTVEPLPTLELPPVPEPLPEGSTDLDAIRVRPPTYRDDFNRDRGAWSMATDEGVETAYARRSLRLRIDRENFAAWSVNGALNADDFLVEVDVARTAGAGDGTAGIIFAMQDDNNFLYFAVNFAGQFSLWQRTDGQWANLLPWIEVSAINRGDAALNRLGVLKRGDEVKLLANNFVLVTTTMEGMGGGLIGLAAETADVPGVEVSFDNLTFWDLTK